MDVTMIKSWWVEAPKIWSRGYAKVYFPLHLILMPLTFLFGSIGKQMRNRLLAIYFEHFTPRHLPFIQPMKTELFAGLKQQKKVGEPLRILEVGAGSGSNLQFFPDGSELQIADPNDSFMIPLLENLKQYPGIVLKRNYVCYGEDMRDIPSGSVDAVVTSCVHCSVTNTRQFLKEINRVLVPGGKYYFIEHCLHPSPRWRFLQLFLTWTNIWGIWSCGCQFRDIQRVFEESGVFHGSLNARVNCTKGSWTNLVINLVASNYVGVATKEEI